MKLLSNIDKMIIDVNKEKEIRINNYHSSKMTAEYFIDKELEDEKEIKRLNSLKEYFAKCSDDVSIGYLYV